MYCPKHDTDPDKETLPPLCPDCDALETCSWGSEEVRLKYPQPHDAKLTEAMQQVTEAMVAEEGEPVADFFAPVEYPSAESLRTGKAVREYSEGTTAEDGE